MVPVEHSVVWFSAYKAWARKAFDMMGAVVGSYRFANVAVAGSLQLASAVIRDCRACTACYNLVMLTILFCFQI
jgi:hypothetical protein